MKNKSIEEILNNTIKECIENYRDTEQGNCRSRYELLMLDVVIGRLKTHGYLDEDDFKKMITLIWEFLIERGMAIRMPDI